jgi:hypothetical protein
MAYRTSGQDPLLRAITNDGWEPLHDLLEEFSEYEMDELSRLQRYTNLMRPGYYADDLEEVDFEDGLRASRCRVCGRWDCLSSHVASEIDNSNV